MTLPPPSGTEDEQTFSDAEEELDWMLDCIAIETRIRTALRLQDFGRGQGFGGEEEESGGESSFSRSPAESGEFVAVGAILPWGRYLPPSSC
jgi:hypothetical protein